METNNTASLIRTDLQFSSQQHLGKKYTVVKDPITTRYFRFTESQGVILDLLREPIAPADLAAKTSERLGGTVSVESIHGFLKSLADKLLLDTEEVREKLANYKSQTLEDRNVLYWKLASINPERIFAWLVPRTTWAFTRWFHVFAIFTIASGLVLNYLHLRELTVNVQDLFNLHGLLLIWLVTMVVVTLHEFAHGLTCCHFGGKVKEIGFMLIYFQPAFYCDVSDSWMFTSKRHRMWVTLAGGYFQLVVWGICTFIWRLTAPDSFINQLTLLVIVFAGLQTIVNFNPLIKLDGYYMLSDYLEIPNLRAKAASTLWNRVAGRANRKLTWREERAQLIYGTASLVFSTSLLIYVYTALYSWVTSEYAFAGLIAFAMFSSYTLRRTAMESVAGLRAVLSRAAFHKYRNAAIVGGVVLISFVGQWELKIPAEFRVIPRNDRTVRAETGGVIVEMLVQEGSRVAKGQVLARLRDFDKQQRISDLAGQLDQKQSELALLRAGARPEEIDRKQKLVETKRVELQNATRIHEQRNHLEQTLTRTKSELQHELNNLKRTHELSKGGLIAKADLDKAETAVKVREADVRVIEAEIRVISDNSQRDAAFKSSELAEAESELKLMLAGSRPETVRQVEAEIRKLQGQLQILNEELERTEIRAPIDGIVTTPFMEKKLNDKLLAGTELCRLVDMERVTIEMLVPELEMSEVRAGSQVTMRVRSFPSLDLHGRVDFIAPVAQNVNGQQMVAVRSELPNEELMLKPDMTGVAKISAGDRRIVDIMARRVKRWIRTEFWDVLP